MKTILIYFITVIMAVNFMNAQQSYKLVDPLNKWYEYGQYGGYGPYPLQNVHKKYFFNGDTLINSISYKKLYMDVKDTTFDIPPYFHSALIYRAAFRQDSLKVYFIMPNSSIEKLYCDFNLSVGDTLKYYYNNQNILVSSVDSILYGSNYRRKYTLNNNYHFYEGIGNSLGLLRDFSLGIEGGVYLVCFQQNGINQNVYDLYGTPPPCGLNTDIADFNVYKDELNIYPNPFSEYTTISIKETPDKYSLLVIYNIQGSIVKVITNIQANKVIIPRKNMTSGLYLVMLISTNNIIKYGKIIVE